MTEEEKNKLPEGVNININTAPQADLQPVGMMAPPPHVTNADRIKNWVAEKAQNFTNSIPAAPLIDPNSSNAFLAANPVAPIFPETPPEVPIDVGSARQPEAAPEAIAPVVQASQPQQPAIADDPYMQQIQKMMGQQQSGLNMQANALAEQGRQQAEAAELYQRKILEVEQDARKRTANLETERTNLTQDMMNGEIKPDAYFENMSTGKKIQTAIGLILGGMGGGLMKQENPALKFLQDQINRDINAQKTNMDKKATLLGALDNQFNNIDDSTKMAFSTQASYYSAAIQKAAANSMGPLAAGKALAAAAAIQAPYIYATKEIGAKRALASITDRVQQRQASPEDVKALPGLLINSKIKNNTERLKAFEEIGALRDNQAALEMGRKTLRRLQTINTYAYKAMHPIDGPAEVKAIMGPQLQLLVRLVTGGRGSDTDTEEIRGALGRAGLGDETYEKLNQNLTNLILSKRITPILDTYDISKHVLSASSPREVGADQNSSFDEQAPIGRNK